METNGILAKKNNKFSANFIIILLISTLIGLALLASFFSSFKITRISSHSAYNLEQQISKIAELATIKYFYRDILEYKDNLKFKEINIPLTEKKFLVIYGGYIKAGVDLGNAQVEIIDNNSIHITAGKPKILDNVIDESITSVYDEKDGLFNKITIVDYNDIQIENKTKLEKKVIGEGLLIDAEKNAHEILTAYLSQLGFTNITVSFTLD